MKRYDTHMHLHCLNSDPQFLLDRFEEAGIYGSNVFSVPPKQMPLMAEQADFETRLADVLRFTEGRRDRLFPILWIHPDEEGEAEKIAEAAERGIMGYKMICNSFYVYEDKSMKLLEAVAKTGKPIFFHSGILWDGRVSSCYNRPANWECCLEVPGLRFSLAHCSWPWIDECIALYGKFLSAYNLRPGLSAEMYMDMTPGTPMIYRRELLTKLHTVGYDVKHNLLFGLDQRADSYNPEWAREWLKMDESIYDELGLDEETRGLIYEKNLLRIHGISGEQYKQKPKKADEL